jgi:hypothetical protein
MTVPHSTPLHTKALRVALYWQRSPRTLKSRSIRRGPSESRADMMVVWVRPVRLPVTSINPWWKATHEDVSHRPWSQVRRKART